MRNIIYLPLLWLKRFRQNKGYGVQSPFAYRFLQDVVKSVWPYYAYTELETIRKKSHEDKTQNDKKTDEFLFRLSNFLQPPTVLLPANGTAITQQYLEAGCKNTQTIHYHNGEEMLQLCKKLSPNSLLYVDSTSESADKLQSAFPLLDEKAVVYIKGIDNLKKGRQLWDTLCKEPAVVIGIDMKRAGILFKNTKLTKGNYRFQL